MPDLSRSRSQRDGKYAWRGTNKCWQDAVGKWTKLGQYNRRYSNAEKKIEARDGVKDAVQSLRKQGKSYKAIADELKLTVYEVKKHCQNKSSL